ncbi:MAG: family 78 glycoside hydrolase catalytic domain [Bacteroidales bacterium]
MQKLILGTVFSFCSIVSANAADIAVAKMTCEMNVRPLALDCELPRFGWQLASDRNGVMQSAYELELFEADGSKRQSVWKSGKIRSDKSQLVDYAGNTPLKPAMKYIWKVRVWDQNDQVSEWSEMSEFRLAPSKEFLNASWIGAISHADARIPHGRKFHQSDLRKPENKQLWADVDTLAKKSISLRKSFPVTKKGTEATAYVCGLGHYEFSLNGDKVGDGEFTPLWSDYEKTVYYNVFDVTDRLRKGENAIGVMLGNGFYNVQGGRYRKLQVSFGAPTLFFKLLLKYTDGSTEEILSDAGWKYSLNEMTFNCLYGGENFDARLEQKGWNLPGFDDSAWKPVVVQDAPKGELTPQVAPPVKVMERYGIKTSARLDSIDVTTKDAVTRKKTTRRLPADSLNAYVFDMGQNMAGVPEIVLKGRKGDKVRIWVGESLGEDGAVSQKQTGGAHYYDYTLKGEGDETYRPRFSYYGFRYIQVEGVALKGDRNKKKLPVMKDLRSCFLYNSAPKISEFNSSNAIFNDAHRIIEKAVRSNMQAVFTDCPHREKLGWLEQIHLNGPGLFYNYDLTAYIPKVLRDMSDSQYSNGMVPTIAPEYTEFGEPFGDSPEWGSSAVIVPFQYYDYYGDNTLIRQSYPMMRKYVDYLTSRADNHIVSHGLGDWYDYGDFRAGFSRNTPVPLVATAHYYQDILYVIEAARMLGNQYDVDFYTALATRVKDAFNKRFFNEQTAQYGTGSQCSNALPLFLDMMPEGTRAKVLDNLVSDVHKHGDRLTTGDVGNRYLFQTLARNGQNELMYKMHNHQEAPGYGFQLLFGATTLTEQWDPRQGASWNHFMMGQIDEWFFSSLAGINNRKGEAGFRRLEIRPQVVGDLNRVQSSFETLYGIVSVQWQVDADRNFRMKVKVPANCTADIYLPGEDNAQPVGSGEHLFTKQL